MATLVTGGAGYIGSHMVLALVDAGRPVVVLDNFSTGFRSAIPEGVPLVEGCVGDGALVGRAVADYGVEAIVHFAGSAVVPDSLADPLGYYLNNTVRSRALIAAAVAGKVRRFVFSSTAAVYSDGSGGAVDESSPVGPVSPYGASKLMTERMLTDAAAAHDFRYAALRYFNVAGADPAGRAGQSTQRATHLIKVACEAAVGARDRMQVFGDDYPTPDGTCVRDYIHVTDLVKAHVLALDHLAGGGDSLLANCGYGRGVSVMEVIQSVKRVSGADFPVEIVARRAGDLVSIFADPAKLKRTLGWSPDHAALDTIVAHALAWEKRLAERGAAA